MLAACGGLEPPGALPGVRYPDTNRLSYPGTEVPCNQIDRCRDMLAELERWSTAHAGSHGPARSVTFHEFVDDQDKPFIATRSGGDTWIAVLTFDDGYRVALAVGCGVGIRTEVCFTRQ